MAAYDLRDLTQGAAVQTTLSSDITTASTSITIAASTNWPSGGGNGNFFIVINRDGSTEEKIECSARSTNTLTVAGGVAGRGKDGTSAAAHVAGEAVEITYTARDFAEANYTVSKTVGKITGAGDILIGDAANSLVALSVKTSGRIIVGSGTTAASVAVSGDATLASSGALTIANNAITTAKILDGQVTAAKLASGVGGSWVTVGKTADESITSSNTLQNDDHLFFTAASGVGYAFQGALLVVHAVGTDPRFAFDLGEDSTATRGAAEVAGQPAAGRIAITTAQGGGFNSGTTTTTLAILMFTGVHVGAGGTFRVRWAPTDNVAVALTVKKGSWLMYQVTAP